MAALIGFPQAYRSPFDFFVVKAALEGNSSGISSWAHYKCMYAGAYVTNAHNSPPDSPLLAFFFRLIFDKSKLPLGFFLSYTLMNMEMPSNIFFSFLLICLHTLTYIHIHSLYEMYSVVDWSLLPQVTCYWHFIS